MPVPSPRHPLCFWSTSYRLEVPMTPSLGLVNFLEWLPELREILPLLAYQFITGGNNPGTARWKRYRERDTWEGHVTSMPSQNAPSSPKFPCVHQPGSSLNHILLGFYRCLSRQDWWLNSISSSPARHCHPQRSEAGLKVPTFCSRMATSPHS